MIVSMSGLVFVSLLVFSEGGAGFFFFTNRKAKQGKTKANAHYFRQSIENCSILD